MATWTEAMISPAARVESIPLPRITKSLRLLRTREGEGFRVLFIPLLCRLKLKASRTHDCVIGAYASGLVYRMRVAPLKQNVLFRADNKKCRAESEYKQTREIEVAAIHNVECASFGEELVKDIDIAGFAIGDADKRRNIAGRAGCPSSRLPRGDET
jgi:hypothetical protein